MKRTAWSVVTIGVLGLAACSAAQPTPVSDNELSTLLNKGAQVQYSAGSSQGTMTFFGDKTVSREAGGSGQIDDGTWSVVDGKLCITWKSPAVPERCMTQMRTGTGYQAVNPDGSVAMTYTVK